MLTLFHAPQSRSTRIVWLLEELGAPYDLHYVTIRYMDGRGGGPDAANPHPDKKVPALRHGETLITESAAIALYLSEHFGSGAWGPSTGDAGRGAFLTWICWIEGEFGPAIFQRMAAWTTADAPPAFEAALHRLRQALAAGPFLMGEHMTAADVMLGGTLGWAREFLPLDDVIDAYLGRLVARPAFARAMARDAMPSAAPAQTAI